jgi:hypothetical protein
MLIALMIRIHSAILLPRPYDGGLGTWEGG